MSPRLTRLQIGTFFMIGAYVLWGSLPVYWKLLKAVPAEEIIAHRIVWSCLFVNLLAIIRGQKLTEPLKQPRMVILLILSGIFITLNWFIYIWAVNNGHIVDASLGYYINPLVSVLMGILFLGELIDAGLAAAFGLAITGVVTLAVWLGVLPWISLLLAGSFAVYGLLKKIISLPGIVSLGLETLAMLPIGIGYLAYRFFTGQLYFGSDGLTTILLILCGIVTAVPLVLFAEGAQRIPLSLAGFIQYVSPSLSLILGLLLYGERFTPGHMIAFSCIWIAIGIYSFTPRKKRCEPIVESES